MVCIILLSALHHLWLTKLKSLLFTTSMNFLHKEKKNNIICHSENKGEEVTAVIIGLLPYKALKRFFIK